MLITEMRFFLQENFKTVGYVFIMRTYSFFAERKRLKG